MLHSAPWGSSFPDRSIAIQSLGFNLVAEVPHACRAHVRERVLHAEEATAKGGGRLFPSRQKSLE